MSEKQELIRKMIKMQKDFIAQEHQGGVDPKDYFAPENDHPLSGFRESYADLAADPKSHTCTNRGSDSVAYATSDAPAHENANTCANEAPMR